MIADRFGAVLKQAQNGDEAAFAALYRELNPAVLRYFAAHSPSAAEDLASETWIGAAKRLAAFEGGERAFRAWLFTIAHRRLVQHWRDVTRRPSFPVGGDELATRPSSDCTEEAALRFGEAAGAARRVASALPPDQASVVLLRVLGGLGVEEVARILGKRPGTVRVLQHKALRRLRRDFAVEPVTLRPPGAM